MSLLSSLPPWNKRRNVFNSSSFNVMVNKSGVYLPCMCVLCVCVGGGVGVYKWEEEDWTSRSRLCYFLLQGQDKASIIYKNHSCQTGLFSSAAKRVSIPVAPKIITLVLRHSLSIVLKTHFY